MSILKWFTKWLVVNVTLYIFGIFHWLQLLLESVSRLQLFTRVRYLSNPLKKRYLSTPCCPSHLHFRMNTTMYSWTVWKSGMFREKMNCWARCCRTTVPSLFLHDKCCNSQTFLKTLVLKFVRSDNLPMGDRYLVEELLKNQWNLSPLLLREHKLDPKRTTKQKYTRTLEFGIHENNQNQSNLMQNKKTLLSF